MDSTTFMGNIVEIECGESRIYIGTVENIDSQLQEISLVNGKKY